MTATTRSPRLPMKTLDSEDAAHALARSRNVQRVNYVVVEGPEDGEWTVMHILDAIENDLPYSWGA